jgi:propionyl-CoA carboxylase alpha chain
MLAKVIAKAPTRSEAAGRLALALERLHLGGVTTNRDFLVATLRMPAFLAGDTTTDFIDRVDPPRSLRLSAEDLQRAARVAALWAQGENRAEARVLERVPSGWRNARLPAQHIVFEHEGGEVPVRYLSQRDGSFLIDPSEEGNRVARIHAWSPEAIDVEIDGRRTRARITRHGDRLVVHGPRGDVPLRVLPRFVVPGSADADAGFVARMPGKVTLLRVAVGDRVEAGQTLLVLEAMKMEHPMNASFAGVVVEVRVAQGDQVESGAVLLVVEPASEESAPEGAEAKGGS